MQSVAGQMILLGYSFIILLRMPVDTAFVAAFLGTAVYVSAVNMETLKRERPVFMLFFFLAACFLPEFLLFTPAVLYSILEYKKYIFGAGLGALCIYSYLKPEPEIFALLVFGSLLSYFLSSQAGRYARLEEMFQRTRDDGTELNLLLQEKNQSILERQDYEIYTATLKERNRIAREIHDHVGHMLSRAILMVGAMKAVSREEALKEPLGQLEETLHGAMTNVRESVHDLYDDSVNLKEVLEELAAGCTFCRAELVYDMGNFVPREVKYSFIAIVKEAFNNVAKHSNASLVELIVREHPGLYQLVIRDNGTGAGENGIRNPEAGQESVENPAVYGSAGGMGIRSMKDRVQSLGGTIQIGAKEGFRIFITVPKEETA